MRVIAGRYKGRRLNAPTWTGLRPTSDRLKQTLFDVLGGAVAGARVLDGFAGSGALGIEALSRGAAHATFVDADSRAAALIRGNLAHCGITDGYVIIRDGFVGAVRRLPSAQPFDLVLLDPPYGQADLDDVLVAAGGCLNPQGILVLEHARRSNVTGRVHALVRYRTVTAGDSALAFFRLAGAPTRTTVEDA